MRRAYYQQGPSGMSFGPGPMTPAVKMLLWANVGVFVAGSLIPPLGGLLIEVFGLRPQAVVSGLRFWQPATYMFLHGSIGHVFFNMLVLWMFGVQLERLWGPGYFLRFSTSSPASGPASRPSWPDCCRSRSPDRPGTG